MFKADTIKILTGGLASLLLIAISNIAMSSTTSSVSVDLSPMMLKHAIQAKDIEFQSAVILDRSEVSKSGWLGSINPGSLVIKPLGQSSDAIGFSLRLNFTGAQLKAQSCSSTFQCDDIEFDSKTNNTAKFNFDGNQWSIKFSAPVCKDSLSCTVEIPSWSMEQRRASNSAAFAAVPEKTLIVEHKFGIDIIQAETGQIWLSFEKGRGGIIDKLGSLESVQSFGTDLLAFTGTNGGLILDFGRDRAVMLSSEGASLSDRRIGGLAIADGHSVEAAADGGNLLGFGAGAAVWQNGSIALNLTAEDASVLGSYSASSVAFFSASLSATGKIFAATCNNNRVSFIEIGKGEIGFYEGAQICNGKSDLFMIDATLIQSSADGWRKLAGDSKSNTSIVKGLDVSRDSASYIILKSTKGDVCTAEAYYQHATVTGSFAATGLKVNNCDSSFGYSPTGISFTSRSGRTVLIDTIIP